MKFGASIWPFQWDPPYKDGISRVASLGFEAVELIGWNRELLQEYYTSKKVEELRAFVEDAGLEISEFVSTPEGMASPDDKERDRAVEHFKRAVEVTVGLGTGIVNSVSAYPFDLEFPPQRVREDPLKPASSSTNRIRFRIRTLRVVVDYAILPHHVVPRMVAARQAVRARRALEGELASPIHRSAWKGAFSEVRIAPVRHRRDSPGPAGAAVRESKN